MHLLRSILALSALARVVAGNDRLTFRGIKEERARRLSARVERDLPETSHAAPLEKRDSVFLNSKSKQFAVNGTGVPGVNFDLGESYAGVLPISDHPDESRKLYFWFFPSSDPQAAKEKEIVIWLQGGPGGASTGGLILENGPFLFQPGTVVPTRNNFAWTNFTNVVWVDQPVGTGWSVGTPNITNEYQLADQFMGFFKNFVDTFSMQGYKVYLAGESYAGYYIPYIANGFVDAKDKNYFNLAGTAINDPIIGNAIYQFEGVAMQYLNTWSQVFGLSPETMANISAQNQKCGYQAYLDKYFRFPPPKGPFPGIFGNGEYATEFPSDCDVQGAIVEAVTALNPCFNEDHIFDTCPTLYSPLGPGIYNYAAQGPKAFYDRPGVAKALNAPPGVVWHLVAEHRVFVGPKYPWEVAYFDASLPPAQIGIVSKVIEATNNVIVGVGGLDFQLPANGTLLVFQNMTWNGGQGFSNYPNQTLYVPQHAVTKANSYSGTGDMGSWTAERGLTFYISKFAGHEDPWYTPGVAYRVIQTLLGRIPNLSATDDF